MAASSTRRSADLPRFLRRGDLLVANNTRVFAARLLGRRDPSRRQRRVSARLAEPRSPTTWHALMHPGQKLKPGATRPFRRGRRRLRGRGARNSTFRAAHDPARGRARRLRGRADRRARARAAAPYIKRPDTAADRERYQTVFAEVRGSVAAPTAGLHFTPRVLDDLARAGVRPHPITLHVGYGTFKPVRVEAVEAHVVDPERYKIEPSAAEAIDGRKRHAAS